MVEVACLSLSIISDDAFAVCCLSGTNRRSMGLWSARLFLAWALPSLYGLWSIIDREVFYSRWQVLLSTRFLPVRHHRRPTHLIRPSVSSSDVTVPVVRTRSTKATIFSLRGINSIIGVVTSVVSACDKFIQVKKFIERTTIDSSVKRTFLLEWIVQNLARIRIVNSILPRPPNRTSIKKMPHLNRIHRRRIPISVHRTVTKTTTLTMCSSPPRSYPRIKIDAARPPRLIISWTTKAIQRTTPVRRNADHEQRSRPNNSNN